MTTQTPQLTPAYRRYPRSSRPAPPSAPRPSPRPSPCPSPRPSTTFLEQRSDGAVKVAKPPLDDRRVAVYRRRRAAAVGFVALVVGVVLVMAFVGGRASADGSPGGEIRPAAVYVVRPGDTLWDLAVALAPDRDPRLVVDALERSAGGAALRPGQRIVVPASLQR